MRLLGYAALLALTLGGCVTHEDAGVAAARMERQDDATCQQQTTGKGTETYQDCRRSLMAYRQQTLVQQQQEQARRDAVADSLAAAGRAMQSIDQPPQQMNVNVTCTFGCR